MHRQVLAELAATTPLLPGADVLAFVDVDSTHRQVFGYGKQGAAVGRLKGVKTLHPLLATISTPIAAPVIAGIRLRKGRSADVRGASSLLAEALATARQAGAGAAMGCRHDVRRSLLGSTFDGCRTVTRKVLDFGAAGVCGGCVNDDVPGERP